MSLEGVEAQIVTAMLAFLGGRGWTVTSIADETDIVPVLGPADVLREVAETALARINFTHPDTRRG